MNEQVKTLDEPGLARLQALEGKLGVCVVAWERQTRPASITDHQLNELQAVEKDMGAVLVAYEC